MARLRVEEPGGAKAYHPAKTFSVERGAYVVALRDETTWVELVGSKAGKVAGGTTGMPH